MKAQGRKEVAEQVVQAALIAVATQAVTWAFERFKAWYEREPQVTTIQ